jgi:signal transduction histidine kinase
MTAQKLARRSLQRRLALAYAAGIYAAGVFVLVFVDVPLASVQAATPVGGASSSAITETGPGISLPQLLTGSAVALVTLIPVANASHELRTPLAGLRTLLEVALADPDADADTLRSACEEALALGGHQERLIRALLALATSERGVTRWDALDLAHVVEGVLASRRDQATETGIDLAERLAPAMTAGDPRLIESLVANLVDNAIRHNHAGGQVEVTTRTSGAQVALTVANSGPVVPGDQIQRLLQPFQKLAPERHGRGDGYGLGLAIVDAVTHAHHATLTTSARPEGGLSITVQFARAWPDSCGYWLSGHSS